MSEQYAQSNHKSDMRVRLQWRVLSLLMGIYDFVTVCGAWFLALLTRFDFSFSKVVYEEAHYFAAYQQFILPYALFTLLVLVLLRLYKSMWQYASFTELVRTMEASFLTSAIHAIGITLLYRGTIPNGRMPISYYLGGAMAQTAFLVGIRFFYRFIRHERQHRSLNKEALGRVMLIGAGDAGQMILRDVNLAEKPENKVVCIIDDDPNKWGRYMDGVLVVGGRDDILVNVKKYHVDKIFLAIPSANAEDKREILNICSSTDCELKQLPGMYQLISGQLTVSAMKDVSVEDLLGRAPIHADMSEVFS